MGIELPAAILKVVKGLKWFLDAIVVIRGVLRQSLELPQLYFRNNWLLPLPVYYLVLRNSE